ncbi:hypothetical protein Emed_005724 [Eimeria media]
MEPPRNLLVLVAFACVLTSALSGLQGGAFFVAADSGASSEGVSGSFSSHRSDSTQQDVPQQHRDKHLPSRIVPPIADASDDSPSGASSSLFTDRLSTELGGQGLAVEKFVAMRSSFLVVTDNSGISPKGFAAARSGPPVVPVDALSASRQEETPVTSSTVRDSRNVDEGSDPTRGPAEEGDEDLGGEEREWAFLVACWRALGALQNELLGLFSPRRPPAALTGASSAANAAASEAAHKESYLESKTPVASGDEEPRLARARSTAAFVRARAQRVVAALLSSLWPRAKQGVSTPASERETVGGDEGASLSSRQQKQGSSAALAVGQREAPSSAMRGDSVLQQPLQQVATGTGSPSLQRSNGELGGLRPGVGEEEDAARPGSVILGSKPPTHQENDLQSGFATSSVDGGEREAMQLMGSSGEGGETGGGGDLDEETAGSGPLVGFNMGLIGIAGGLLLLLLLVLLVLGLVYAYKKRREKGKSEKGDSATPGPAAGSDPTAAAGRTPHSVSRSSSSASAHELEASKGGGRLHSASLISMASSRRPGDGLPSMQHASGLFSAADKEGAKDHGRKVGRSFSTEIQSVSKQQQQLLMLQRASCLVPPAPLLVCRPTQFYHGSMSQGASARGGSFLSPVLQQQQQEGQSQQQQQVYQEWRSKRLQEFKSLEAEVERELAAQGWTQQDPQRSSTSTSGSFSSSSNSSFSSSTSSSSGNELHDERQRGLSLLGQTAAAAIVSAEAAEAAEQQ